MNSHPARYRFALLGFGLSAAAAAAIAAASPALADSTGDQPGISGHSDSTTQHVPHPGVDHGVRADAPSAANDRGVGGSGPDRGVGGSGPDRGLRGANPDNVPGANPDDTPGH